MANEQNLIPRTTLSTEEAKRLGSLGGKASVKKRREKKKFAELFEDFLSRPIESETVKKQMRQLGFTDEELINKNACMIGQFREAMKGNTRAFEIIRDTIGEKPVEQIQNLNPPVIQIERPSIDD